MPGTTTSRVKSETTTPVKVAEAVNQSFNTAVKMMARAGFKIRDNVKVSVNPQLPFMGYTMPQGRSFKIVVSGGAVGSGMLEGLLVHEMSHIIRIQNNHPSHNAEILEGAVEKLASRNRQHDYQRKILHDLLNDIQDLYADDIAFRVLRTTPTEILDKTTEFLQSWVVDKPVKSEDAVKDRWVNASIMAHNARAIAQMARLRIQDTGQKAARSNQRFLSEVHPDFTKKFDLFQSTLTHLKEEITEEEYGRLLAEHLNHFVELAEAD